MVNSWYACGGCGRPVDKNATYCTHCNVILRGMRCSKCGYSGHPETFVNSRCPKCGNFCATVRSSESAAPRPVTQSRGERLHAHGKSPVACLLISFLIPGLGTFSASEQGQKERPKIRNRALMLFGITTGLLVIGVWVAIALKWPGVGGVFYVPLVWGMVDAYRTARKWNRTYAAPAARNRRV